MTKKTLTALISILVLMGGLVAPRRAQAQVPTFRIPITVTDSLARPKSITSYFGVHPNATKCIDTNVIFTGFTDHWDLKFFDQVDNQTAMEQEFPPPFAIDIRFVNLPGTNCLASGVFVNIHKFSSATQIDTFRVGANHQEAGPSPMIYSWPSVLGEYCDSMFLVGTVVIDPDAGTVEKVKVDMTKVDKYTAYFYPLSTNQLGVAPPFQIRMYGPKVPPPPPDSVLMLSPADGDTNISVNPTITWSPGVQPRYYRYQFSDDSTFARVLFEDTVSTPSKHFTGLQQLKLYYWRVVIYNPYGVSFYQKHPFKFRTQLLPPDPPVLVAPPNGQQELPVSPTLKWRNAPLAPATYQVLLALDTGFTSIVKDTSGIADTTVVIGSPLQKCLFYYWKVRGTNYRGAGLYSSRGNFRVTVATPGLPVLTLPLNGDTGIAPSPTLSWAAADLCSDLFLVQVARDTGFTNLVANAVVNQASASVGPLGQDSIFYWRIKARNVNDSSQFTAYRSFKTRLDPPSSPALVFPNNGDTTRAALDTLRWRKTAYTSGYHLQIARDISFTQPLDINDSTITDTIHLVGPLEGCSKYFWRVRSKNRSGNSSFSTARNFKVRQLAPTRPILTGPANDTTDVEEFTTLRWRGDACAASYFYHVSKSQTFSDTAGSGTTSLTSANIGPLAGNTTFYWHVRGINGLGVGVFSDSFKFKTTPLVSPAVPVLRVPANGAANVGLPVRMTWDSSSRAATYRLQVSVDSIFALLVLNDSTIQQQVGVQPFKQVNSPPLQNSTTYYWKVSAKNDAGVSAFSAKSKFATLFPPVTPLLLIPQDDATDVTVAPLFQWSVTDRATAFQLQVAKDTVFSLLVFNDTTVTTESWRLPSALESITKYYWRVRGKNTAGWGPWSVIRTFTTTRTGVGNWVIPLTIAETGPARDVIYFGVNPYATNGIDPNLGEFELPPSQFGFFDARWISPVIGEGLRLSMVKFVSYTQKDTFQVQFQAGNGTYPMKLSWPRGYVRSVCDSIVMLDQLVNPSIRVRMDIDSTLAVSNGSIRSLYLIKYGAYGVLDVKPVFTELPKGFVLNQNYPNPFNPTTRIQFSTDRSAQMRIAVYDVLGREVAVVANSTFFPGQYSLEWNGQSDKGTSLPSGVYYVRMIAVPLSDAGAEDTRFTSTRKMLMIK